MCLQAKSLLLSFVPGTFMGACAMFAGQSEWRMIVPSLAVGLLFGYAMKNSGLWIATRRAQPLLNEQEKIEIKVAGKVIGWIYLVNNLPIAKFVDNSLMSL